MTYNYLGSCALLLMTGPAVHVLVGGTLLYDVETNGFDTQTKAQVLIPNQVCTGAAGESSASGLGPFVGLYL